MPEQSNVDLVKSAYEAFSRGDIRGVVATLADNVDWYIQGPASIPMIGRRHGPQEVAEFFKIVSDTEEAEEFEPKEFIAQGDDVVVLGHYRWRMKSTGRVAESDFVHVFVVRNGKIASYREYTDTAAFAAALGVSSPVAI